MRRATGDGRGATVRPRPRRVGWLVGGATATAAVVAVAVATLPGVLTADGSDPSDPARSGPLSGQEILLVAGLIAEAQPTVTGTYWHVKTMDSDESPVEFWATHDGDVYVPSGTG